MVAPLAIGKLLVAYHWLASNDQSSVLLSDSSVSFYVAPLLVLAFLYVSIAVFMRDVRKSQESPPSQSPTAAGYGPAKKRSKKTRTYLNRHESSLLTHNRQKSLKVLCKPKTFNFISWLLPRYQLYELVFLSPSGHCRELLPLLRPFPRYETLTNLQQNIRSWYFDHKYVSMFCSSANGFRPSGLESKCRTVLCLEYIPVSPVGLPVSCQSSAGSGLLFPDEQTFSEYIPPDILLQEEPAQGGAQCQEPWSESQPDFPCSSDDQWQLQDCEYRGHCCPTQHLDTSMSTTHPTGPERSHTCVLFNICLNIRLILSQLFLIARLLAQL